MREFKDKEWDARYENFKLAKERRRARELGSEQQNQQKSNNSMAARSSSNSARSERSYVNKGPSRFMKTHNDNVQTQREVAMNAHVRNHAQAESIRVDNEMPAASAPMPFEVEKESMSFGNMIPYIAILFGVVILVLVLTKVITL